MGLQLWVKCRAGDCTHEQPHLLVKNLTLTPAEGEALLISNQHLVRSGTVRMSQGTPRRWWLGEGGGSMTDHRPGHTRAIRSMPLQTTDLLLYNPTEGAAPVDPWSAGL